ncbi:MAG: PQQ-binding-like beta-propeller repeat protein [Gemmataceae bacterium]
MPLSPHLRDRVELKITDQPTLRRRVGWTTSGLLGVLTVIVLAAAGGVLWWKFGATAVRFEADSTLRGKLESAELPPLPDADSGAAGDWPQWRGPRRDGLSLETGLNLAWPATGPKVLWQADIGDGFATLAVSQGKAVTLTQDGPSEAVVCWDADTGAELWRYRYPADYVNNFGSGPRSTPTIDGDRVYSVGATGWMHCLNLRDGTRVWSRNLLTDYGAPNLQWGVSFSPLVEDDLVYTNPGGPEGNSLVALHKHTGKEVWKALDDRAGYSSPIAATMHGVRQILFFTGDHLVSVHPRTGEVFWKYPWITDYGCNIATPIVVGNYVFISSGYNRGCALLEVEKRPDGSLRLATGQDGKQFVYEGNQMCNHFSTCVYLDGYLYGFNEKKLTCMDFRQGDVIRWEHRGFDKGALMIADGHLIILGENGYLAAAQATPEGYREVSNFRFSKDRCWVVPVVANGKLYVRDLKRVVCYDVR